MAVAAAVLGAAVQRVRIVQLHQVDHLRADPQPGTAVGELIVRAVGVHLQAQGAAVKVQRALEILAEERDMVHAVEQNTTCSMRRDMDGVKVGTDGCTAGPGELEGAWGKAPLGVILLQSDR